MNPFTNNDSKKVFLIGNTVLLINNNGTLYQWLFDPTVNPVANFHNLGGDSGWYNNMIIKDVCVSGDPSDGVFYLIDDAAYSYCYGPNDIIANYTNFTPLQRPGCYGICATGNFFFSICIDPQDSKKSILTWKSISYNNYGNAWNTQKFESSVKRIACDGNRIVIATDNNEIFVGRINANNTLEITGNIIPQGENLPSFTSEQSESPKTIGVFGNRVYVLTKSGKIFAREGSFEDFNTNNPNTPWVLMNFAPNMVITDFAIGTGNRLAAITDNKELFGTSPDKLYEWNKIWTSILTDKVDKVAVTEKRIAVIREGKLYIKDGEWGAGWY